MNEVIDMHTSTVLDTLKVKPCIYDSISSPGLDAQVLAKKVNDLRAAVCHGSDPNCHIPDHNGNPT